MSHPILLRLLAVALLTAAPLATALWSPPAAATTFANLSIEQKTDASTAIVRGTVLEVWTELDEYERPWTRARVAVNTTYKGNALPTEIVVDQLGGKINGVSLDIPGRAWFSAEEDILLFLHHHVSGRWVLVESSLGKLNVRREPGGDRLYLRTWQQSLLSGLPYDGRFLPHPPAEQRLYLDEVLPRIESRVTAGWDGLPIPGISADTLRTINLPEMRIPR